MWFRFRKRTVADQYLRYRFKCQGNFICLSDIKESSSLDILRETQISQFYRYTKKTQISLNSKKYRYVGDIQNKEGRAMRDPAFVI
jgi:hypothetical protein